MSVYNLYSDAKFQTALTAIGAGGMGQQEVDLLKQIFVAAANGGGGGGASSFNELSGSPYDNAALAAALGLMHKDASDFIPRTTTGCGITALETATNFVNRDALAFDPGTNEFAQVWFNWPTGWNTLTVTFFWQATSGTGSAVFGAQARVYNDGDSADLAFGTAQTVTDAAVSANTVRQSAATAAITPAGTITANSRTCLQIYRDATAGGDDLAVDALVTAVLIQRAS